MQQTQINIYNGKKQFRYGVEYVDNIESINGSEYSYIDISGDTDCFQFTSPYFSSFKRNTNKWTKIGPNDTLLSSYIPSLVNLSSVNVYFPSYGVETYTGNWLYIFSAYTFINGDKIILCETLIDRRNALAYPGKKVMHNIRYSEYVNIKFPDPWYLTYDDDWIPFRENVCGEPVGINNTGSLLTIEIHPVKYTENKDYIKLDNYLGGLNSMLLSDSSNISLSTRIEYHSPREVELTFSYDRNLYTNGLDEYIQETYKVDPSDNITYRSTLTLYDNSNIFNIYFPQQDQEVTVFDLTPTDDSTIDFSESGDGWDTFYPGLQLKAVTEFFCEDLPLLTLISNPLYVTQDMFAAILENEQDIDPQSITDALENDPNINPIFMESFNIVNKTQKQIINIEKPNDFKNNLTRPVFIRAQKNNEIIVHPAVTENISINLREYKNYVETFTLRIADTEFVEYGRQSSNIIFKVVGKQLPEEIENGIYYVLDDNKELVTSGNYILE